MTVEQTTVSTRRGDEVTVTLFDHAGQPPTVLISVADADESRVPTAEFTLAEAADLREAIRRLCEGAARRQVNRASALRVVR
jgi:hypothetical protein